MRADGDLPGLLVADDPVAVFLALFGIFLEGKQISALQFIHKELFQRIQSISISQQRIRRTRAAAVIETILYMSASHRAIADVMIGLDLLHLGDDRPADL